MFKEILISAIVIIAIIILNIVTQNYTDHSVYSMSEELSRVREEIKIKPENNINLSKDLDNIYFKWKELNEKLSYYIEHDELEKVETEIVSMKSNIEMKQYDDSILDIDRCVFILQHIREKNSFNLKNIF